MYKISSEMIEKALKLVEKRFFLFLDKVLNKRGTIILLYHQVTPHIGKHNAGFAVIPELFREQMAYLRRNFEVINLKNFLTLQANKNYSKNRTVVITFDDGSKNIFNYAFPILKTFNLKATVFLTTNFIGKSGRMSHRLRRWTDKIENENDILTPFLSWDEIRIMMNQNIEIGAHSCSHPLLTQIPSEEAKKEIVESKNVLEKNLGIEIEFFAYPFGDLNSEVLDLVIRSGFSAACVVNPGGINNYYSDRFTLTRHGVSFPMSMSDFKFRLTPYWKCHLLGRNLKQKLQKMSNRGPNR